MDAVSVAGPLIAAGAGYALRYGQDWFAWYRSDVREDRNRWKAQRVGDLQESAELVAKAIQLTQTRHTPEAWRDGAFAADAVHILSRLPQLKARVEIISAHVNTGHLLHAMTLSIEDLFPEAEGAPAKRLEYEERLREAQRALHDFTRHVATQELGLRPNGIFVKPPPRGARQRLAPARC